MIGRLRGIVISKVDALLLDVSGVGYVINCSDRTLAQLPSIGHEAIVHTELVVREDLMQLYGFATLAEREWYRLLTSVQGVGAKAALAILGTIGIQTLARALTLGDMNTVKAAPGVGPKLAARICNELKDKAAKLMGTISSEVGSSEAGIIEELEPKTLTTAKSVDPMTPSVTHAPNHEAEAISALVNLGYDRVLAAQTVGGQSEKGLDLNALITAALRAMASKG